MYFLYVFFWGVLEAVVFSSVSVVSQWSRVHVVLAYMALCRGLAFRIYHFLTFKAFDLVGNACSWVYHTALLGCGLPWLLLIRASKRFAGN